MKIIIEHDDGTVKEYVDITDYYLALRSVKPAINNEDAVALLPETKSFSYGANLREIAKEIYQSYVEIQDYLKTKLQMN